MSWIVIPNNRTTVVVLSRLQSKQMDNNDKEEEEEASKQASNTDVLSVIVSACEEHGRHRLSTLNIIFVSSANRKSARTVLSTQHVRSYAVTAATPSDANANTACVR